MRLASVIALLVLSAGAGHAQSKEQATGHFGTVAPARAEVRTTTNIVYRSIRHPSISVGGPLAQAIRTRRPLQLINPFAPASYGSALGNTSHDPLTGQADGFKIFSVGF